MAGLVGQDAVRAAVKDAVGARNKRWKVTMWSDFLKCAVAFLLAKGRDQDDVECTTFATSGDL